MTIKELFEKAENGTLTWETFESAMKANKAKFVDLNEGNYVSKQKYDDDISSKTKEIDTLNTTISTRDADLAKLKDQLKDAGTDSEKLTTVTNDLSNLQTKYNEDIKNYKAQLAKQAYEFAVKDYANGKEFTSGAAKRDFVRSMIAKELKMDNGVILGADDFVTAYSKDNADAFKEAKDPEPTPEKPKPSFINPTPGGAPAPTDSNDFTKAFHFTGVRKQEN